MLSHRKSCGPDSDIDVQLQAAVHWSDVHHLHYSRLKQAGRDISKENQRVPESEASRLLKDSRSCFFTISVRFAACQASTAANAGNHVPGDAVL